MRSGLAWMIVMGAASAMMATSATGAEDVRIPAVPQGHPRVYVRPNDVEAIRAKIELPEFQKTWKAVSTSDEPTCAAMTYMVTGDRAKGRFAIEKGLEELSTYTKLWNGKTVKDGRPFYNRMHKAAMVYDWCYDLLTKEEKNTYVREFITFTKEDHNRGYPPSVKYANMIVGHSCEGWIMTNIIPSGLAIHDEFPEMFEIGCRIFLENFVPVREYTYRGKWHHQGVHYSGERTVHDAATAWLFRRIGAGDILPDSLHYVPYEFLYSLRPDRKFMMVGDDGDVYGRGYDKRLLPRLVGLYYNDPYLLGFSDAEQFRAKPFFLLFDLLFLPPGAERRPLSELPLTHHCPEPAGQLMVRTGWQEGTDSPVAMALLRIGDRYFGNHHHDDFGTFQLYYKGALAIDSGMYFGNAPSTPYGSPHWKHYYRQTIAHNGLLIFDPATTEWDDGGQGHDSKVSDHPKTLEILMSDAYDWADVTACAFGPDPEKPVYNYIAGNITNAYAATKAERITRAMLTLETGDAKCPMTFVVYDEVAATKPEFKKAFYLHTVQQPKVDGHTITVVRDEACYYGGQYDGKLVAQVLEPQTARIDIVGGKGKECWNEITGENYYTWRKTSSGKPYKDLELGAWRTETIPTEPKKADTFFHVMNMMDKDATPPEVRALQVDRFAAAATAGTVILIGRGAQPATSARFAATQGDTRAFIAGLAPGHWTAKGPGGKTQTFEVTPETGIAWLDIAPGDWSLSK